MAEKKINGRLFKVQPMLATKALVLQGRLLKALGPAIPKLREIIQNRGENATEEQKAASMAAAMSALGEMLLNLDPLEYARLIGDIVEIAQIQRADHTFSPADLDGDFTESQQDILPVVFFVLKEQFGSFFKGMPGIGSLGNLAKV